MQTFIEQYFPLIFIGLSIITSFVSMVYTRRTGKNIDKGVSQIMKYRTPDYREKQLAKSQTFSPLVQTYRLDNSTGELVENDIVDIDKLVASNIDSALERMLERFMPVDVTDKIDGEISDTERDLSDIGAAMDALSEWRERLRLDDLTPADVVLAEVEKYRNDLLEKQKQAATPPVTPPAPVPSTQDLQAQLAALSAELEKLKGADNA